MTIATSGGGDDGGEGEGDGKAPPESGGAGEALVQRILSAGIDGFGPVKGAVEVAQEVRATARGTEDAVKRLIAMHRRFVGASGFATGFGGLPAMAVTVPADVSSFYIAAARMSAGIAHLRGYDAKSEEVRSLVLVSLLGASGATVLAEVGVAVSSKAALSALRRLPGRVLIDINKKVGFRLVTKFGQKGVINLVKVIPVLGGGVGATVNVASINTIAAYARSTFPPRTSVVSGRGSTR
jgi:hypothetical protein